MGTAIAMTGIMRAIGVLFIAATCWTGCLSQLLPQNDPTTNQPATPVEDLAPAAPARADAAPVAATDAAPAANDLATAPAPATDGAVLAAFGAVCITNSDCQSDICQPANMGANMECTTTCTMIGLADPACPGAGGVGTGGMCNMKGYCKP